MAQEISRRVRRPVTLARLDTWVKKGLLEEARAAVSHLSRKADPTLTMVALIDRALRAELDRLRRLHRVEGGFPKRRRELKRGSRARQAGSESAK